MIHQFPNMLMIAGSGRHIGKTTLACRLIKKYSANYIVVGLKVTSVYPNDNSFHGSDESTLDLDFEITEETDRTGIKDTSKMLLAGADSVFYMRTKDAFLEKAFEAIKPFISHNCLIVVESTSLRRCVEPGLFLLVKGIDHDLTKQSIRELSHLADLAIVSDGKQFDKNIETITFDKNRWNLQ